MRTSVLVRMMAVGAALCGVAAGQRLVTTVAGSELIFRGEGRPGAQAPLGRINAITVDPQGRAVFPDPYYHMVLRVESDGSMSVVAGNGVRGHSGDGGPAKLAALNSPSGVAYDANGNLYISDTRNHRIRRVSPDGIITTFAGTGGAGFSGDGGLAVNAVLNTPLTLAADARGNVFINDAGNVRIRRVDPNGSIVTVAGNGRADIGPDGPALQTSFADPETLATEADGSLLIAELSGHRVRRLSPQGNITTIAGTGRSGFAGDNGPAAQALLSFPGGVAVERDGSILIVDTGNYRVRRVNRQGVIQTIAGSGRQGFADGSANQAQFRNSFGVAVNSAGDIFLADRDNFRVRRLTGSTVSTLSGNGGLQTSQDGGPALNAPLITPFGVSFDRAPQPNMLIADTESNVVRLVAPSGVIRTIAGNGAKEFSGDRGPALQAGLSSPQSVNVDCNGNYIIADTQNNVVRRIDRQTGNIFTIAGDGNSAPGFSGDNGPGTQARLNYPVYAISDSNCNIFISDNGNNRVRRLDSSGTITTVAGGGSSTADGVATATQLQAPAGLAIDAAGNLYIAEVGGGRIRRLASSRVSTIAGGGTAAITANPVTATSVRLRGPVGIALDSYGRIYVSDVLANAVYEVENSRIRLLAGDGRRTYAGDGGSAVAASFNQPIGIAATEGGATTAGNVYVADSQNNRIRAILPIQPTFTPSSETLSLSVSSDGSEESATLDLRTDFPGMTCELSAVEPWMRLNAQTATLPASVLVRVDPTGLREGTVRGTINVNCGAARVPTRAVAVALSVRAGSAPKMSVDAETVNVAVVAGTPTVEKAFSVRNTGSGSLNLSVTADTITGSGWLTASAPASVTAAQSGTVTVVYNTAELEPGTYSGYVTVTGSTNDQPVRVPVRLTVNPAPGKIALSQAALTFTAVAGGGAPLPQEVVVSNAGEGLMAWQARTNATGAGAGWLRVTTTSGRANAVTGVTSPTEIAVDPSGLGPGTYYGQMQVLAEGAANSPQTVGVVLNVVEPSANPGPEVRPAALTFAATESGNPGGQIVRIANLGTQPVSYTSSRTSTGGSWINVVPANATLAPGEQLRLVVQPDLTALASGVQTGAVDLRFDDGTSRRIDVLAIVPEGLGPANEKGVRAAGACSPSRLLFQMQGGQGPLRTRANQPVNVETQILDNCGAAIQPREGTSVNFTVASAGESGGPLAHSSGGKWTRTFQTRSASPGTKIKAFVTAIVVLPGLKFLADQFPVEVEVTSSGGAVPLIAPGALLNAASLEAHAPVAPGMLITLKGQELGENPGTAAETNPLPTNLGITEVRLGDRPLRLLFASGNQVNAQVPFDITPDTEHQIVVRRGDALSVPEQFVVASVQPAVFTENQAGTGNVVAINAATNQLVNAANPAKAGDVITIFATGLGKVSPEVEAGMPAPLDVLSRTVAPVEVLIGDVPAEVSFAGLQPGVVARYQINLTVPAGVPTGDQVPLVVRSARQASQTVTIAIR